MPGLVGTAIKFVLTGHVATDQTWSTSTWGVMLADAVMDQAALNAVAVAAAPDMANAVNTLRNHGWSTATTTDSVSAYFYASGDTRASGVSTIVPEVSTGSSSSGLPPFCSVVASLRSLVPGRSGRGRNYLPVTASGILAPSGDIDSTKVPLIATEWAAWLTALSHLEYGGTESITPAVVSFTKGDFQGIDHVIVDSKVDTQHRRSNHVPAASTSSHAV